MVRSPQPWLENQRRFTVNPSSIAKFTERERHQWSGVAGAAGPDRLNKMKLLKWITLIYVLAVVAELAWSIPRGGRGGEFFSVVPGPVWRWWHTLFS